MRTLLAGEFATATTTNPRPDYYGKLEVQNGSGTWKNVATVAGSEVVINASGSESVDSPVGTATFQIVQKLGTKSLAPLITSSTVNVLDDGVTYSPLFDKGRLIRYSVATMAAGVALDATKYREMFTGRIDDVDHEDDAGPSPTITLQCSDLGAWLMDLEIEGADKQYGTTPVGTALETVLQNIINDNLPVGDPAVTVVKESSSTFAVTDYTQTQAKVLAALTQLVLDSTGEDFRYRYDASHVSQPMWYNPDRTRVTVDQTFASSLYVLRRLNLSIRDVRNAGRMPSPQTAGTYVTASDATSISKYRRRFFQLPASTQLTANTQAQAVINAAVADLKDSPAEVEADLPYLWFVQLFDRYTFTNQNRQFDTDQTFGVVGHRWSIQGGAGMSTLTLAGRVVGAYSAWLKNIAGGTVSSGTPPTASITRSSKTRTVETLLFNGALGDGTQSPLTYQWRTDGGSWSASATMPSGGTTQAITRDKFYNKVIDLQTSQADGLTATFSYTVEGQFTGVDDTTGKVARGVPADDGNYSVPATSSDGYATHGSVYDSRTSLLNTHGRLGTDTIDNWLDNVYGKVKIGNLTGGNVDLTNVAVAGKWSTNIARSSGNATQISTIVGNVTDAGHAASTMQDSRTALLNTMGRLGTDTVDNWLDGGGFRKVSDVYVDTSNRPTTIYRTTGAEALDADTIAGRIGKPGDNLVLNPSGQDGALGSQAPNWTYGAGANLVPNTGYVKTSGRSLALLGGGASQLSYSTQSISLENGKVYELTGWIKAQNVTSIGTDGRCMLDIHNGLNATLITAEAPVVANTFDVGIQAVALGLVEAFVRVVFLSNANQTLTLYLIGGYTAAWQGDVRFAEVCLRALPANPTVGGNRGYGALDANNRLVDARRLTMDAAAGLIGTQNTNPLSAVNWGISITGHILTVGGTSITYSSGTYTVSADGTYYVYAYDPTYAGGAVSYVATTSKGIAGANGNYLVGKISVVNGQTVTGTPGGNKGTY